MSNALAQKNDLINIIYGCVVRQALANCKDNVEEANQQLEMLGHGIGMRLIDEFLIKTETDSCKTFKDVSEKLCLAFQRYLGIDTRLFPKSETEFALTFTENAFDENVCLPEQYKGLKYSIIICGLVRGALEALNYRIKCTLVTDRLSLSRNSITLTPPPYEMNVELVEIIKKKLVNYDE